MKFIICDFAFCCQNKLKELGYDHLKEMNGDIFQVAKEIWDAGLNVMLYHSKNRDIHILYVDNSRFQQR